MHTHQLTHDRLLLHTPQVKNVRGVPRGFEPVSLHRQFFKIETVKILENCSAFFLEEATQSHASSKWYN